MRTLWIKPGGFLPLDAGGKIRSYHTVKNLAALWPTTVLTFYPSHKNDQNQFLAKDVEKLITVPFEQPLGPATKAIDYGTAVLTSKPYMFQKFCQPEVIDAVQKEIRQNSYDLIVCDFLLACGVVPFNVNIPRVVFTHNVESRIWERHYNVASNFLGRWVAKREWEKLKEVERSYLTNADLVLAVSPSDRDEFIAWGITPESVVSVPTGVDTDFFAPQPTNYSAPRLVFTGSMDWMPNQDGMIFFLEEVLHLIRKQVPELLVDIVGRKPPAAIRQAAQRFPGVTVTGWVEDVRPHLAASDVCIVPLRVGSGTRLKIFEAMAMGKAIVSTTIGAEGLPVTHQQNIMIADSPTDFSARVVELLSDKEKRDRMGIAARTLVQENFSWHAATVAWKQAIESGLKFKRSKALDAS